MQVTHDFLRAAASHLETNTATLNGLELDNAPQELIEAMRGLVLECDLLLTVSVYRYLRSMGRS